MAEGYGCYGGGLQLGFLGELRAQKVDLSGLSRGEWGVGGAVSEGDATGDDVVNEDDLAVWFDGSTAGLFGLDAPPPAGAVTLNNVNQPDPSDPAGYPYAPAVFGGKTMRWGPSSFHADVVIHAFLLPTQTLERSPMTLTRSYTKR